MIPEHSAPAISASVSGKALGPRREDRGEWKQQLLLLALLLAEISVPHALSRAEMEKGPLLATLNPSNTAKVTPAYPSVPGMLSLEKVERSQWMS